MCSYPYVKKSFKTQHGRIPIDPAILAAIAHRFIAKKRENLKWRHAQRPETGDFFWGALCAIFVLSVPIIVFSTLTCLILCFSVVLCTCFIVCVCFVCFVHSFFCLLVSVCLFGCLLVSFFVSFCSLLLVFCLHCKLKCYIDVYIFMNCNVFFYSLLILYFCILPVKWSK